MSERAKPILKGSYLGWATITVPIILLLGIASGRLSDSGYGNEWFDALVKPAIMPPGWAFGVAWSILYILMAAALCGECCSGDVNAPPIHGRSTNGRVVLIRSRSTTAPPGCAARHLSTKSDVSLREVERPYRGLAVIARSEAISELQCSEGLRLPLTSSVVVVEKTGEVSNNTAYIFERGSADARSNPSIPCRR